MKISGIVKKGAGRGKRLGFPTANIDLPKDLEIEDGLYLGRVEVNPSTSLGQKLASLIFVGANETFGESEKQGEVYILDFEGDLYGQKIFVEIIKKIRDVIKFSSVEDLISQMKKDEIIAKEFFGLESKNNN
jgi:riboflavin kinase/FMN adenylyltransferase